jgi:molecular chaperone DnaJ
MKVPALTQSGRQIKLKGLGMPNLNGKDRGDLLARVRVVIPEHLSDEERKLFEELRELRANGHGRAGSRTGRSTGPEVKP